MKESSQEEQRLVMAQAETESYLSDFGLITYQQILGIDPSFLKGKKVLNLGSGINDRFSRDGTQKGINGIFSMRPVKDAENTPIDREFLRNRKRNNFIFARGQEMPYKSESFDCAVALYSVPFYLPRNPENPDLLSPEQYTIFFREVLRILKPGGKAFFCPILKNFHDDPTKEVVPREFIINILDQFSNVMKYSIEEINPQDEECRLVITKNS